MDEWMDGWAKRGGTGRQAPWEIGLYSTVPGPPVATEPPVRKKKERKKPVT